MDIYSTTYDGHELGLYLPMMDMNYSTVTRFISTYDGHELQYQ